MKTLSILLGIAVVVLLPMRSAALEMGFNQDITNNTGQDAFDFHLEGTLKSADPPIQLRDFCFDQPPGSIPGFDWQYDGGTITHVGGNVYHYSGGWSGTVPVPPGQMIHIGKYFDETCENTLVDLHGWWTDREGRKINPEAGTRERERWLSDVPLLGFEIVDNIPARLTDPNLPQTVTLYNATNHLIQIASAFVAVTDVDIPLEALVPESELLDSLDDWRDFPSSPFLCPGESWTFDLSEAGLVIPPDWTTVIRAEILDVDSGAFHFYASKCQAHGAIDRAFRVDGVDEWRVLLNRPEGQYPRIEPVDANTFAAMVDSSDGWPVAYRRAVFATPELWEQEHADGSGRVEPALYMRWGPEGAAVVPGQYYAAAWDYDYGRASDLRDVELEFSVHAPWESTHVSINLIDADGDWLEFIWHVGLPREIPACEWTTVRLHPSTGESNYLLERPAFEGGPRWGPSDGAVDLSRIIRIRFDENEVWTDAMPFPLDAGWVWNAWDHIAVEPVPPPERCENIGIESTCAPQETNKLLYSKSDSLGNLLELWCHGAFNLCFTPAGASAGSIIGRCSYPQGENVGWVCYGPGGEFATVTWLNYEGHVNHADPASSVADQAVGSGHGYEERDTYAYDVPSQTLETTYHMRPLLNGRSDPSAAWLLSSYRTPQQDVCPASCSPCPPSAAPGVFVSNGPRITPVQFVGTIRGGGLVTLSIHRQQVIVPTMTDMTVQQLVQQIAQQFNRYWQQVQRQQQAKSADIDPTFGQILHLRNVDVQELTVTIVGESALRFEFNPHFVQPVDAPDLIPVTAPGNPTFCERRDGLLRVHVKNQGTLAAEPSLVEVLFRVGEDIHVAATVTDVIDPGQTQVIELDIPADCYQPDCRFTITVDSLNEVEESDETNNCANGTCVG